MPSSFLLAPIIFHLKRLALIVFLLTLDTVGLLPAPLPAPAEPPLLWSTLAQLGLASGNTAGCKGGRKIVILNKCR